MQRILLLLTVATAFLICAECYASDPFANNTNYIKVFESSVPVLYLNKNSVQIKQYAPPVYEISCNTTLYDKYAQKVMHGGENNLMRYNFDTKQIWLYNFSEGRWYEQDVQGVSKEFKRLFNEVFRIAYNRDFYGGIADERIAIGGISPFTGNIDYLRKIYGEPTKIIESKISDIITWEYNQTFSVNVGERGSIWQVRTEANNGLKTPDGIGVGSKVRSVIDLYGVPYWGMPKDLNNSTYEYKGSKGCNLTFVVKNGIVSSVVAGWNP